MIKVLIVDDDEDLRGILKHLVITNIPGARAIERESAEGLLELCRRERPQLILLDWVLGAESEGTQVCRKLKEDPDTRDIPVVILTGSRKAIEDRFESVQSGADLYVEKPFKNQELVGYIQALLSQVKPRPRLRGELRVGEIRISRGDRLVWVGSREIPDLPEKLFMVLWLLVRHSPHPVETQRLIRHVWKNQVRDQQVAVAISRLRDRLGPLTESVVEAVPNLGYRIRAKGA